MLSSVSFNQNSPNFTGVKSNVDKKAVKELKSFLKKQGVGWRNIKKYIDQQVHLKGNTTASLPERFAGVDGRVKICLDNFDKAINKGEKVEKVVKQSIFA